MNMLHSIQSIKYLSVLDLIKSDEVFDKKRNVLNGEEVFKLCHRRYQYLQSLLLPLKEKLGRDIQIIDIGFAHGMQDDTTIFVRYNDSGNSKYLVISHFDFNDISISSSETKLEKYGFIMSNKKIILNIFKMIYNESLDSEFYITSTSKRFIIIDNCTNFSISDTNKLLFLVEGSHSMYGKKEIMYDKEKIISAYKSLREVLMNDENIQNIYRHIHVYEDDFPKYLIKN